LSRLCGKQALTQKASSMGSSRFLKAIKARHRHGPLVVKTFLKPEAHYSLRPLVRRLRVEREALEDVPNVLTYQKVVETETAGYLIRQWMASNLYDRISTRPFLTSIEKKWITYQLLSAMTEARKRKVSLACGSSVGSDIHKYFSLVRFHMAT
jgi:phosphoinositide-3-kinase regulatory subunit 4